MIANYSKYFANLHTATNSKHWSAKTHQKAPHKPLLLLTVIDHFAQGSITTNLITLNTELAQTFALYWAKIMPFERRGNVAYPFFHLRSEKFWHLIPKPEMAAMLEKIRQVSSISEINSLIIGAKVDKELYALLSDQTEREALRKTLIEAYFAPEIQPILFEQAEINLKAFQYSLELVEPKKAPIAKEKIELYPLPARDQGFRLAIVKVYQHRCTICGIRALTPEGHSVIDAAHIVPWSISHNDHPRNGIAMCKLCHWMFDEGLISISSKYVVIISPQLSADPNIPGHLVTLNGRGIIEPINNLFLPDVESLKWHNGGVFRAKKERSLFY